MGLHAQHAQAAVEALARPVAPGDRLIDARGKQQLGRDLAAALGHPDLIARHARPAPAVVAFPAHPLRVDGVRQAVLPLQLMHHPVAARPVVGVADGAAVEADARRHDMHVVLGVRHDDVGCVPEAHALQVVPRERGPLRVAQALAGGQAQGAMVDRPRQVRIEPPHHTELVGQLTRGDTRHVAPHDARRLVLQLRALLEHVVEYPPEAPPGNDLLDHAPPTPTLTPRGRPRRRVSARSGPAGAAAPPRAPRRGSGPATPCRARRNGRRR